MASRAAAASPLPNDELRYVTEVTRTVAIRIHGGLHGALGFLPPLLRELRRGHPRQRVPGGAEVGEIEPQRFGLDLRVDASSRKLRQKWRGIRQRAFCLYRLAPLNTQSGDGLTLPGDDPLAFSDMLLSDRKLGFVGHTTPSRLRLTLHANAETLALDARSSPDAGGIVDAAQVHDLSGGDLPPNRVETVRLD
jgi:hypothetical protein